MLQGLMGSESKRVMRMMKSKKSGKGKLKEYGACEEDVKGKETEVYIFIQNGDFDL